MLYLLWDFTRGSSLTHVIMQPNWTWLILYMLSTTKCLKVSIIHIYRLTLDFPSKKKPCRSLTWTWVNKPLTTITLQ